METWIMIEGQWMHIVITFDGKKKKTYIDGELWSTVEKQQTKFTDKEVQEIYSKGVK